MSFVDSGMDLSCTSHTSRQKVATWSCTCTTLQDNLLASDRWLLRINNEERYLHRRMNLRPRSSLFPLELNSSNHTSPHTYCGDQVNVYIQLTVSTARLRSMKWLLLVLDGPSQSQRTPLELSHRHIAWQLDCDCLAQAGAERYNTQIPQSQ